METWKKSFASLWVAELLAIIGFSTSNPMIPLYLKELGVSDPAALNGWTGAINASSSLALAIFAPIWGALADSYGKKPMLMRAMFGGSVAMGLLALTTSPWQVLALKTLQGCITGTIAAATVLTATIVPQAEVGYRLGLLHMAVFMGNSLGPMFGGVVTDLAGSRTNFLATAILLLLAGIIVTREVIESGMPKPKSGSLLRNAVPDIRVLRSTPGLSGVMVVIFVVQFANAVVGPLIPLVVMDMKAGSGGLGSLSGLLIGVASLAGALGAVITGKTSAKLGYSKALLVCLGGAFLFYVPQGFADRPWQLLILRAFSGFFLGGTMPTANALIALRSKREKQGAVYGLSTSISNAGGALGPAYGAVAASTLGYPAVFFTTSLLLGVMALAVALREKRELGSRE
ncbi:MAG TPA: MFS transporter [Rectinemataceae bacterium]